MRVTISGRMANGEFSQAAAKHRALGCDMNSKVSIFEKAMSVAVLIITAVIYALSAMHFSSFKELFEQFNSDLPWNTKLVIRTYYYWAIFIALGSAGTFQLVGNNKRSGWAYLSLSLLLVLASISFGVWSMYGPVIEFGNAT